MGPAHTQGHQTAKLAGPWLSPNNCPPALLTRASKDPKGQTGSLNGTPQGRPPRTCLPLTVLMATVSSGKFFPARSSETEARQTEVAGAQTLLNGASMQTISPSELPAPRGELMMAPAQR